MKQSISRRQFLKASGLAAAGACAAGLLSSCGGKSGGSSSGSASGADTSKYTVLYSSQPATLNYLTTATDLEMIVGELLCKRYSDNIRYCSPPAGRKL